MVSLAQLLLVGVAGFVIGNCVAESGAEGPEARAQSMGRGGGGARDHHVVALVLGALSSRTYGIYFLMLTLTYAVIGYYVFGQVTTLSGFGGITGIDPPSLVRRTRCGCTTSALVLSVLAYLGFRAIGRTPFGLALEGVRDDPVRMASLGFNVPLHRTLAFTLAGFVAGDGRRLEHLVERPDRPEHGRRSAPRSICSSSLSSAASASSRAPGSAPWCSSRPTTTSVDLPLADKIGITEARFNTVVGAARAR